MRGSGDTNTGTADGRAQSGRAAAWGADEKEARPGRRPAAEPGGTNAHAGRQGGGDGAGPGGAVYICSHRVTLSSGTKASRDSDAEHFLIEKMINYLNASNKVRTTAF